MDEGGKGSLTGDLELCWGRVKIAYVQLLSVKKKEKAEAFSWKLEGPGLTGEAFCCGCSTSTSVGSLCWRTLSFGYGDHWTDS